jgi:recombination protein RecR
MRLPKVFKNLVNEIEKLPGVGQKSAMRLALSLVQDEDSNALSLASALTDARKNIEYCSICGTLADGEICDICSDPKRDQSRICVVENVIDMLAIERAGFYEGVYHVLGGVISPLDNIDESSINIDGLIKRLNNVNEIIFSLPSSVEADATFLITKDSVQKAGFSPKFTRVAVGLAVGSNIDYADSLTLIRSFENRVED